MKVLAVVGLPGSGKGEFSQVAQELNIPVVVMGDVIRQEAARAGLPPTDESMGIIARRLRQNHGMAAIALACIPYLERYSVPLVLIDGIRGDAEVLALKKHFRDFSLISIDAPREIRFQRLSIRGRPDDLTDQGDLIARDDREASFGLLKAMEMADYHLSNMRSREIFLGEVRTLIQSLQEQTRAL